MKHREYQPTSLLSADVEPRASGIEGRGLYARRPLRANETVLVLGGQLLDDQALAAVRPHSSLAVDEGWNLVQTRDDPAQYLNHCCDPSCWMRDEVTVVTRRAVSADEELTLDYALVSVLPEWRMECRCGSTRCRGVVTGNDWKHADLRARYAGHFSPFINRRIREEKRQ